MIYYEHYLGDYAQATAHLSMLEDAAYSRLLRWYYAEEKPLPADEKAVCRIARAVTAAERQAVKVVLGEFFQLTPEGYRQGRADKEIARYQDKRSKAKSSAKARWSKTHSDTEGNANGGANAHANASPDAHANALRSVCSSTSASESESKSRCAALAIDPGDPRKQLWDLGLSILGAKSRSLLAKAIGDVGEAQVGEILGHMAVRPTADPRSYFVAATKPKQRGFVA